MLLIITSPVAQHMVTIEPKFWCSFSAYFRSKASLQHSTQDTSSCPPCCLRKEAWERRKRTNNNHTEAKQPSWLWLNMLQRIANVDRANLQTLPVVPQPCHSQEGPAHSPLRWDVQVPTTHHSLYWPMLLLPCSRSAKCNYDMLNGRYEKTNTISIFTAHSEQQRGVWWHRLFRLPSGHQVVGCSGVPP